MGVEGLRGRSCWERLREGGTEAGNVHEGGGTGKIQSQGEVGEADLRETRPTGEAHRERRDGWEASREMHGEVSAAKLSEKQKGQGRRCRQNRKGHKERGKRGALLPQTHRLNGDGGRCRETHWERRGGGGRTRQMRVMDARQVMGTRTEEAVEGDTAGGEAG